MTWAISATGTRDDVKAKITEETARQVGLGYFRQNQGDALQALVDATEGNRVSVNASGHNSTLGGSASYSISTYNVEEKVPVAGEAQSIGASDVGSVESVIGTSSAAVGQPG